MGANKSLVFVSAVDSDARRILDNAQYCNTMCYSCIRSIKDISHMGTTAFRKGQKV